MKLFVFFPMIHSDASRHSVLPGPASSNFEMIEKLFLSGADIFRLNFSHGEHAEKAKVSHLPCLYTDDSILFLDFCVYVCICICTHILC